MQFELAFVPERPVQAEDDWLLVGARRVRLRLIRNRRARRYVLRLSPDGSARLTIPRGGSAAEANRFAERQLGWLEKQLLRQAAKPVRPTAWRVGTEILLRGEAVPLEAGSNGEAGLVHFGGQALRVAEVEVDLRPFVEQHLRQLAAEELPARAPGVGGLAPFAGAAGDCAQPAHAVGLMLKARHRHHLAQFGVWFRRPCSCAITSCCMSPPT